MYTAEQVDSLISQVEQEFASILNKSEENETQEIEVTELEKSEENYSDDEIKTLDGLYSSMTKSEAQAHFDSIQRVLGLEKSEEKETTLKKSEKTVEIEALIKAEVESVKSENKELKEFNTELKKSNDDLKKSVESITQVLEKLITAKKVPAQKAITGANYIAKSEDFKDGKSVENLTKSEITNKLKNLDYGKLTNSDRDAISGFYNSNGNVNSIKHLLN